MSAMSQNPQHLNAGRSFGADPQHSAAPDAVQSLTAELRQVMHGKTNFLDIHRILRKASSSEIVESLAGVAQDALCEGRRFTGAVLLAVLTGVAPRSDEEALDIYHALARLAERWKQPEFFARGEMRLGAVYLRAGKTEAAEFHLKRGLASLADAGEPAGREEIFACSSLINLQLGRRDFKGAYETLDKILAVTGGTNLDSLHNDGQVKLRETLLAGHEIAEIVGQPVQSRECLMRALRVHDALGAEEPAASQGEGALFNLVLRRMLSKGGPGQTRKAGDGPESR